MSEEEKKTSQTIEEFKTAMQRELIFQTVETAAAAAHYSGDVNAFMSAVVANSAMLICHCKNPVVLYQKVCQALRVSMLQHKKDCDQGDPFTAADLVGAEKPMSDEELEGIAGATNEILEKAFHGRG